jgi:hypothetical protein
MVFQCSMCQSETCIYASFCTKCQLLVDLVAAEAHRDECKKQLEGAEKKVVEAKKKKDPPAVKEKK